LSLIDLLRCPICNAAVDLRSDEAICRDGHRFPRVEGIPVLVDDDLLESDPQYGRQREYFDNEFVQYRNYRLEHWRVSYLDRLREAGLLGRGDGPLIDVGVGGSGYTVIEAARSGQYAVGCDLSLSALLAARRFAENEGVADKTLWICCSAERLPFESSSFASALAIAVIEHVPDDVAALREIARVLRPGGRTWVTVPHALTNISWVFRPANKRHDRKLGHLRRYDSEHLGTTAHNVELSPDEVQFTGHSIKVLQLLAARLLPAQFRERFWWWCEARDLRRRRDRVGSMQLSMVFTRMP
jgi:ubiquinone/menaquinone biosynthesis C-methylase UbiE/uncharacterized protein YbaR (Trm112 family)